jgi:hypothetical protein
VGIYLSTDTLQVMHGSTSQVPYKYLTSTLLAPYNHLTNRLPIPYKHLTGTLQVPYTPILDSYTEVSQLIADLEIYTTSSLFGVKLYDL